MQGQVIFSFIPFYSEKAGFILKGSSKILIENGNVNWENLRVSYISYRDLLSALRSNAHVTHPRDVKLAILERNGAISVIVRKELKRTLKKSTST